MKLITESSLEQLEYSFSEEVHILTDQSWCLDVIKETNAHYGYEETEIDNLVGLLWIYGQVLLKTKAGRFYLRRVFSHRAYGQLGGLSYRCYEIGENKFLKRSSSLRVLIKAIRVHVLAEMATGDWGDYR